MTRRAQLWTEGESGPVQKKQMMVFGAIVAGVLWINNHGDGNTRDGESDQKDRYPVHFQSEKGDKKGDKKQPEPRSTVSYPIKFDRR
ncbi:hypothetical protein PS467_33420 [Streptomyces luomodiensis]|uniref:Uncharacterized protein n=1 Tax=Streptomyces luomodiensis TaxID=3026192 RepID=A0ABY9V509_9ACTN|nr:hypothetical protein [Streptomyces sp. SCA4-21]WNE99878.1 hypothetical protein PS467_33420 [Streptomyces sp. SCA4-21]